MTRRERKQLGWFQTAEQEAENHCKSEAYYLIFKKKKKNLNNIDSLGLSSFCFLSRSFLAFFKHLSSLSPRGKAA